MDYLVDVGVIIKCRDTSPRAAAASAIGALLEERPAAIVPALVTVHDLAVLEQYQYATEGGRRLCP